MQHTNHPDHDLLLIAADAANDLAGPERLRAQAILETCEPCAIIHADLIAIAAATRLLPAPAHAPRDFRLSPDQAASLRRGSWLRTFLAPLSGARSATRPMAAAFTTLGVAGLLVASLLPGMLGAGASSAPQRETSQAGAAVDAAATAAPAAAPGAAAPGVGGPGATTALGPDAAYGGKDSENASAAPEIAIAGGATATPVAAVESSTNAMTSSPLSPLFIGSLALLAVGLVLFGLRYAGRRLN